MSETTSHSVTITGVEEGYPQWGFHCHHAPDDPKWDGTDEGGTAIAGCWALSWWEGVGGELLATSREWTGTLASIPVRTIGHYDEVEFLLEPAEPRFTVEVYKTEHYAHDHDTPGVMVDHRWRARARNGEVLASGEGYTRSAARDEAVALLWPGVTTVEVDG